MKKCSYCKNEFPSGMYCPRCNTFVPDAPVYHAPSATPADPPPPGSLGGWVTGEPADDAAPSSSAPLPPPPRTEPSGPTWAIRGTPSITTTMAEPPGAAGPDTTPAIERYKIPAIIAIVVVGVLAMGFLLFKPKSSTVTSPTAAAGKCVRYNADKTQIDQIVLCAQKHDGLVLGYVGDKKSCPSNTNAILTQQNDGDGADGVLCIDETQ